MGGWRGRRGGFGAEEFTERNEPGRELSPFVVDGEAMAEGLVDGDGCFGVAEAVGTGEDLEDDLVEPNAVVLPTTCACLKQRIRSSSAALSRFR